MVMPIIQHRQWDSGTYDSGLYDGNGSGRGIHITPTSRQHLLIIPTSHQHIKITPYQRRA